MLCCLKRRKAERTLFHGTVEVKDKDGRWAETLSRVRTSGLWGSNTKVSARILLHLYFWQSGLTARHRARGFINTVNGVEVLIHKRDTIVFWCNMYLWNISLIFTVDNSALRHAIWGQWLILAVQLLCKEERERERRGRYKLHEQFCNRAERPNCFAPSASRMCYRWMASGRGNVETRERLGGKLHYMTPRRVVIYVATATHLNRGTKMFVGSIYSLSSLFPFPLAQRTYSIPGTIDMCIRARTGILYTKFSTGLIVATGPCVILLKYFIVFLRNPTERNYHKFNLLHWGETANGVFVILLTQETRNLCTCSLLFSITLLQFLSPLLGDILWNPRDQMSRLGAHDDVDRRLPL